MIPQTQRWWRAAVHGPDGAQTDEGGDCFAACLASIMELPIDGFPNYLAGDGDPEPGGWARRWQRWLYAKCRCELIFWENDWPEPATLSWWIGEVMHGEVSHAVLFYRDQFRWDPAPEPFKRDWTLEDVISVTGLFAIGSVWERAAGPPTFEPEPAAA